MFAALFAAVIVSSNAVADSDDKECPVQSVSGKSFEEEFGAGAEEMTRCIEKREHVRSSTS